MHGIIGALCALALVGWNARSVLFHVTSVDARPVVELLDPHPHDQTKWREVISARSLKPVSNPARDLHARVIRNFELPRELEGRGFRRENHIATLSPPLPLNNRHVLENSSMLIIKPSDLVQANFDGGRRRLSVIGKNEVQAEKDFVTNILRVPAWNFTAQPWTAFCGELRSRQVVRVFGLLSRFGSVLCGVTVQQQRFANVPKADTRNAEAKERGDEHRQSPLRHILLSAQIVLSIGIATAGVWNFGDARKRFRSASGADARAASLYLLACMGCVVGGCMLAFVGVLILVAG